MIVRWKTTQAVPWRKRKRLMTLAQRPPPAVGAGGAAAAVLQAVVAALQGAAAVPGAAAALQAGVPRSAPFQGGGAWRMTQRPLLRC